MVQQGAGRSQSHRQRELCALFHWVLCGLDPATSPSDIVALAQWPAQWWWPAWLAQNGCLLAIRKAWNRQPCSQAGRALAREAAATCGNRGWLLQLAVLLFLTAAAPDRNMSRSWHTSVLFLLCHSAKECCKFLQGYWPKDKETPYPVPLHFILYPMIDSAMVLQAVGRSPQL